jgi:hypothetical protein
VLGLDTTGAVSGSASIDFQGAPLSSGSAAFVSKKVTLRRLSMRGGSLSMTMKISMFVFMHLAAFAALLPLMR